MTGHMIKAGQSTLSVGHHTAAACNLVLTDSEPQTGRGGLRRYLAQVCPAAGAGSPVVKVSLSVPPDLP